MSRVIYDYQIFSLQKYGGISRYFYELASRVAKADGFSAFVIAPFHVNNYLLEDGVKVVGINVPQIRGTLRIVRAANSLLAPLSIRASCPDILHETYYRTNSLAPRGCPTVVTIYDMIHEKFVDSIPSKDNTSEAKRTAVRRADRIICISENTRRDLIDIFGVPAEKTNVIHLGFTLTGYGESTTPPRRERPFILYVGQRGGYKNFDALLTAYASSPSLCREFDLVAFGGGGFSSKENERISEFGLNITSVRQVSGSDSLLASLYRQSAVFVYPSLYEGFGIPPLEAMSLDCPVVCSNTSSIPEVVGDAAYFFDPTDIDAMRVAIEAVVGSMELRTDLVRRGRERIQKFSWDRCAMETMQIYRELLK